ncbi:MAG: M48 family metallopeptidase [Alphaproteobacteria bacterium]|nr:M48 family metallopeptidase [Alphaproteobacteria bacterium]
MQTVGLRTHIWNNGVKSVLLLAGFPVLLLLIVFALAVLLEAFAGAGVAEGLANAVRRLPTFVPVAVAAALAWFAIAWFANTRLIGAMTGARAVTRAEEPRLYNLLENLCISRGLPMPRLGVVETAALNAFAAGMTPTQHTVVVTRGLADTLDDGELEAVLAHELTHVRNGDVRLLVVATVFVGIISIAADLLARGWGNVRIGSGRSRGGSDRKGNAGSAVVLIVIAVACIVVARLLAVVIRFALSRRREFMADAGAVELTRNPDAMIAALRKIEGRSQIAGVPEDVRAMFIDDAAGPGFFARLAATHPTIAERVGALVAFAGGRDPGTWSPPAAAAPAPAMPTAARDRPMPGPWGAAPRGP